MSNFISVGFPRMQKEAGEKRAFLPDFIQFFARQGVTICLEEGYGSRMGFTFDDYRQGNARVHSCSRRQAFAQDLVIILRSPTLDEYNLLKPGAILISMLHFATRPRRIARLQELGIRAISMDCIMDDKGLRLIENMHAVAWNGLEIAFNELEKTWPNLNNPNGKPIQVTVFGTGMVGKHAMDAASKLGNVERNNQHIENNGNGVITVAVGRNLSSRAESLKPWLEQTDILVDATQRRDTSQPVIPNQWIGWLPKHAVIADLSVDPYLLTCEPPVVRGIEGIPQGNLDQYIFYPKDSNWVEQIPESIPSQNCRRTVTCYSWPGIHPEACMNHYGRQMMPLMETLLKSDYNELSLDGNYFERALYRATLDGWIAMNS
jgi:alanine dehydrogenase